MDENGWRSGRNGGHEQEMMVWGAHLLRVFLLGKVSLPFPDALTKLDDVRL